MGRNPAKKISVKSLKNRENISCEYAEHVEKSWAASWWKIGGWNGATDVADATDVENQCNKQAEANWPPFQSGLLYRF